MLPHLTMCNTINKGVISNHCYNTSFIFLYKMLSKTNKFNVIIIKINLSLAKTIFIIFNKILNPLTFIRRTNAIWWIADDNHNWCFIFYNRRFFRFLGDTFSETKSCKHSLLGNTFFKRICKINTKTLIEILKSCFSKSHS